MLCGIGGRTVAEAQQRLSYPEFLSWQKYRVKRGSLHLGMRVERGSALLATLYANAHGKRPYKIHEFMPHEDEPPLSLEQAMNAWH
ncbi:hypothetical protein D3C78_1815340 [compost metagenome]